MALHQHCYSPPPPPRPCLPCSSQEEMYKLRSQNLHTRVSWAEELGSVSHPTKQNSHHYFGPACHKARLGNLPGCAGDAVQEKPLRTSSIHPGGFSGSWGLACHELSTALCFISCSYSQVPFTACKCALPHGAPFAYGCKLCHLHMVSVFTLFSSTADGPRAS